jgi:hypothetical protein
VPPSTPPGARYSYAPQPAPRRSTLVRTATPAARRGPRPPNLVSKEFSMSNARILANQKKILANQGALMANQGRILANQKAITGNQKKILGNQKKILKKR